MPHEHTKEGQDRRPIAARQWSIFEKMAQWLAQRGVSANMISIAGLIFGLFAGLELTLTSHFSGVERLCWLAAAMLIQLRLLMNMLDGMVAIASATASRIGELFNEVPDRIADAAILIGLGYAVGGNAVLGSLAASLAIFVAYVRAIGKAAGTPQQFCGPMAKQQRMFVVTITALYCAAAPRSWQPTLEAFYNAGVASLALAIIIVGCIVTAIRRLHRIHSALQLTKRSE